MNPSRRDDVLFKHRHGRTPPASHLLPSWLPNAPACISWLMQPLGAQAQISVTLRVNEERWRERCHSISGLHSEVLPWPFQLLLNGPKQLYSNAKGTLSSGSHAVLLCWPLDNIGAPLASIPSTEDPTISQTNKGDETITCGVSHLGSKAKGVPCFSQINFEIAPKDTFTSNASLLTVT